MAALFGGVGLAASVVGNLPTLLYRWQHAPNMLGVPDPQIGVSEAYPLRIVELLSPVTQHRFGPFAPLVDHLYEPGREGLGDRAAWVARRDRIRLRRDDRAHRRLLRARADRSGWSFEARLGVIMVAALFSGTKGGISRGVELTGLQGVRVVEPHCDRDRVCERRRLRAAPPIGSAS